MWKSIGGIFGHQAVGFSKVLFYFLCWFTRYPFKRYQPTAGKTPPPIAYSVIEIVFLWKARVSADKFLLKKEDTVLSVHWYQPQIFQEVSNLWMTIRWQLGLPLLSFHRLLLSIVSTHLLQKRELKGLPWYKEAYRWRAFKKNAFKFFLKLVVCSKIRRSNFCKSYRDYTWSTMLTDVHPDRSNRMSTVGKVQNSYNSPMSSLLSGVFFFQCHNSIPSNVLLW